MLNTGCDSISRAAFLRPSRYATYLPTQSLHPQAFWILAWERINARWCFGWTERILRIFISVRILPFAPKRFFEVEHVRGICEVLQEGERNCQ